MHDLEFNKIFAAILVAGIVASGSGFIAKKLVVTEEVKAAGAEAAGGGGDVAAAPEQPEPILDLIAKGDVDHGKSIAKACAACHNFDKDGPNGVGPNLWNVLNRGKAAKADYSYSDDMAKHKGEKWVYEDLNHFLWKPKSFVPGTKMTFVGLKKGQDRADVIAFLRTLADTPPAAPGADEIAKEKKDLAPAEPLAGTAPGAVGTNPAPPASGKPSEQAPAGNQSGAASPAPVTPAQAPAEAPPAK